MKIYVGTLYSIENEFEDCVAAIQRQTHTDFEHFVFSGLGVTEAHATLFKDFLSKRHEFDILIKVDADMVLASNHLFEAIEKRFKDNDLSVFSIAIHDWFTDSLCSGLNAYRNDIQWVGDVAGVFNDNVAIKHGRKESDFALLAPAAYHCPNPSPFQAFHFGMHKAVKVIQPNHAVRVRWRMREHWDNLAKTESQLERKGDRRLALAIIASELVYAGRFKPEHVTYSNPHLKQVFSEYEDMDIDNIINNIKILRSKNGGWLPPHIRQAWLWYKYRDIHLSVNAIKTLLMDCVRPR